MYCQCSRGVARAVRFLRPWPLGRAEVLPVALRRWFSSIQVKLSAGTFALTLLLVGFLVTYFPAQQIGAARQSLEDKALTYASLVSKQAESSIAFDDRETVREIFEAYLDGEIPSRRTSSPEGGEDANAPAATSLERTEEAEVSALLRRRRRAARAAR